MDTPFDLSDLSPEDLKGLSAQLSSAMSAPTPDAGAGNHLDARLQSLCQAVEFLMSNSENLSKRVDDLQQLVMKDLFGAISDQYTANARTQSISGLQSKYGDMMAPHMDAFTTLAPNGNLFDEVHDMVTKAKTDSPDMSDDDMDTMVKSNLQDLIDRMSKVRSASSKPDVDGETTITTETPETPAKARVSDLVRASALRMIK